MLYQLLTTFNNIQSMYMDSIKCQLDRKGAFKSKEGCGDSELKTSQDRQNMHIQ